MDHGERLTNWERRTTPLLIALAAISLTLYLFTTAVDYSRGWPRAVEWVIWAVFATDFAVRWRLSGHGLRFLRDHPADILVLAVPSLRLLRVLGILGRLSVLSHRGRADRMLAATTFLGGVLVLIGAAAVVRAERGVPDATITSFSDGVWWAMTTVTTVGYGDHVPLSPDGRIIGGLLMTLGVGLAAVITSALAGRFIAAEPAAESRATTGSVPDSHDRSAAATDFATSSIEPDRLAHIESRLERIEELLLRIERGSRQS
ncbi:potassium channel family protein [Nocardia sp. NPDC059240]|uniref:potassium channel family protein n=1 Tax=Nocardia sp. NPDC059240 TaxID=3346786 RepID=UPI0036B96AF7